MRLDDRVAFGVERHGADGRPIAGVAGPARRVDLASADRKTGKRGQTRHENGVRHHENGVRHDILKTGKWGKTGSGKRGKRGENGVRHDILGENGVRHDILGWPFDLCPA